MGCDVTALIHGTGVEAIRGSGMYPCQISGLFPTRQGQRLGRLARSVNPPSAKDLISHLTNPTVDVRIEFSGQQEKG
jgi:hypothetical protein